MFRRIDLYQRDSYENYDGMTWKTFQPNWPSVRLIHHFTVDSFHKCGALVFSLMYSWTNGWLNSGFADGLTPHDVHVISLLCPNHMHSLCFILKTKVSGGIYTFGLHCVRRHNNVVEDTWKYIFYNAYYCWFTCSHLIQTTRVFCTNKYWTFPTNQININAQAACFIHLT